MAGAKRVAPGIITFGLGGGPSGMIIGFPFGLGQIEIEYSPGGGPTGPTPHIGTEPRFINVRIKVTFKGTEYTQHYTVRKFMADGMITITKIINTITTNITVKTNWVRRVVRAGVTKIWQLKR